MASYSLPPQLLNLGEERWTRSWGPKPHIPAPRKWGASLLLGLGLSTAALAGLGVLWLNRWRILTKLLAKGDYFSGHQAVRDSFTAYPFPTQSAKAGHTHANCAAERSASACLIRGFLATAGLTPYFIQRSKREEKGGFLGSLEYRWNKDTHREPVDDVVPDNAGLCFVDVDYYYHMPSALISFKPLVLFSFTPSRAGGVSKNKEYWYHFNEDSEVSLYVQGGTGKKGYHHGLWDYGSDELMSFTWFGGPTFYGVTFPWPVTTSYLVDTRRVGDDRSVILLTPVRRWTGIRALVASAYLKASSLVRKQTYNGNGFTELLVQDEEGLKLSVARVNHTYSGTAPLTKVQQLMSADNVSKNDVTIHQVRSWDVDKDDAPAIVEFIRSQAGWLPHVTYLPKTTVRHFQFIQKDYEPDAPSSLEGFMRPLVDGAITPAQCKTSDEMAVKERITKLQKEVADVKPTPFVLDTIAEFVKHFPKGTLIPCSHDRVREGQSRPSQQRLLDEADGTGDNVKRKTDTFTKREAYGSVKPPRNISTIIPTDKQEWTRFIYAVSDYFKTLPWYAFGRNGVSVSKRVVELCDDAQEIMLSDFSRMDGRISEVVRILEKTLMHWMFADEYHTQIDDLLKSQYNLPGRTRFGVKFETLWSRLSGSPETSAFNTLLAAFVAYLAFRLMRVEPAEAWARLGLYGGDDGFTPDIEPAKYVRAAEMMGAKLKVDVVQRGKAGVNFLARYYAPDVWFGNPNSCCDIRRQLSKFHTTVPLPSGVPATTKLLEKSRGYYCTDSQTPIIGPFVSKVVDIGGGADAFDPEEDKYRVRSWASRVPMEDQYPNEFGEWMLDLLREQLPGFDEDKFDDILEDCHVLEDFLEFPVLIEPAETTNDTEETVLVGEEIIKGKGKEREVVCEEQEDPKTKGAQADNVKDSKSSRNRPNNKRRRQRNNKNKANARKVVAGDGGPSTPKDGPAVVK